MKMLGWTVVITIVAMGIFLAATFAGLPQGPTVGFILLGLTVCAVVLGRMYRPTHSHPNPSGDKSAETGDSPDRQKHD